MVRILGDQRGLTLIDILFAVALITFGLVGVLSTYPVGIAGVETGLQESTAAFLAEQMVEQVKNQALTNFASVVSGSEGYATIVDAANYRRVVTVTDVSPVLKQVRVSVFYRPVVATGVSPTEREVRVITFVASRS